MIVKGGIFWQEETFSWKREIIILFKTVSFYYLFLVIFKKQKFHIQIKNYKFYCKIFINLNNEKIIRKIN